MVFSFKVTVASCKGFGTISPVPVLWSNVSRIGVSSSLKVRQNFVLNTSDSGWKSLNYPFYFTHQIDLINFLISF